MLPQALPWRSLRHAHPCGCVGRRFVSNWSRAGATTATPFTKGVSGGGGSLLGWRPGPRWMKNPITRFLIDNALFIATYQLVMEVGLTVAFGVLLYSGRCTAEDVTTKLEGWGYPFVGWISLDSCTYTEEVRVGPWALKPEKLTAAHTGHNIASGLLPLQVLLIAGTYPLAVRGYRAVVATAKGGQTAAASATVARPAGVRPAAKRSVSGPPQRRPSYVRPATPHR